MQPRPRTLRLSRRERLAASYVTGPAGHFVAGSIDIALAVGRLLLARGRSTVRDGGARVRQRFSE
jgi:hypothetical protein